MKPGRDHTRGAWWVEGLSDAKLSLPSAVYNPLQTTFLFSNDTFNFTLNRFRGFIVLLSAYLQSVNPSLIPMIVNITSRNSIKVRRLALTHMHSPLTTYFTCGIKEKKHATLRQHLIDWMRQPPSLVDSSREFSEKESLCWDPVKLDGIKISSF